MAGGLIASFFATLGLDVDSSSFAAGQVAVDAVEGGAGAPRRSGEGRHLIHLRRGLRGDRHRRRGGQRLAGRRPHHPGVAGAFLRRAHQQHRHQLARSRAGLLTVGRDRRGAQQLWGSRARFPHPWGISVRDSNGQLKSSEQLLMEVSEAIKGVPTQLRSDIVRTLFGRGGAELLPLLTDDVAGLREEARRAGVVLSDDLIQAGADLDDQLVRLNYAGQAFRLTIGAGLLPVVREVVDAILAWTKSNRELLLGAASGAVELLTGAAKGLLTVLSGLARAPPLRDRPVEVLCGDRRLRRGGSDPGQPAGDPRIRGRGDHRGDLYSRGVARCRGAHPGDRGGDRCRDPDTRGPLPVPHRRRLYHRAPTTVGGGVRREGEDRDRRWVSRRGGLRRRDLHFPLEPAPRRVPQRYRVGGPHLHRRIHVRWPVHPRLPDLRWNRDRLGIQHRRRGAGSHLHRALGILLERVQRWRWTSCAGSSSRWWVFSPRCGAGSWTRS